MDALAQVWRLNEWARTPLKQASPPKQQASSAELPIQWQEPRMYAMCRQAGPQEFLLPGSAIRRVILVPNEGTEKARGLEARSILHGYLFTWKYEEWK